MQTMQCVYLHGFLSNGNSQKGRWFKSRFNSPLFCKTGEHKVELLAPSYPQSSPDSSVTYLQDFMHNNGLDKHEKGCFLIGSSLGGFYAQYLANYYHLPYILINPALDPIALLQNYLGEHQNPYTQEKVIIDQRYRQQLSTYYSTPKAGLKALLLQNKGDEVIDYRQAHKLYQTGHADQQTMLFDDGDHAFQHLDDAWEELNKWICKL